MLSRNTRNQLVKVIMTIAKEEQGLEAIRQALASQERFSPYTAFIRIKKKKENLITKGDIKVFLR